MSHPLSVQFSLLPPKNEVCEGYVFTGVCLSMGGWHAWQRQGGMHGRGMCAWQGGMHGGMCGRGHAWQGACVVGGMCGRAACMAGGHAWQGVCVWQGHVWWGVCVVGVCMADTMRYGQ